MTLGRRVAVMRHGVVEQLAPPLEVYARPLNTFVARFIGTPPMNLVSARTLGIDAPAGTLAGIRPHDVVIGASGRIPATVDLVEPRGPDVLVHVRLDAPGEPMMLALVEHGPPVAGTRVQFAVADDRIHLFDGTSGARLR
jgi:multiple sugar transport system ATP-binding protein